MLENLAHVHISAYLFTYICQKRKKWDLAHHTCPCMQIYANIHLHLVYNNMKNAYIYEVCIFYSMYFIYICMLPPQVQSMRLNCLETLSANWQTIKEIVGSVTRETPAMIMQVTATVLAFWLTKWAMDNETRCFQQLLSKNHSFCLFIDQMVRGGMRSFGAAIRHQSKVFYMEMQVLGVSNVGNMQAASKSLFKLLSMCMYTYTII